MSSQAAVPAPETSLDAGTAWHYGSPLREQRELAAGRAVVREATRVVRFVGPDTLTWLNSITSQALTGLAAGESTESLILSPQGQIEFALKILVTSDGALALVDAFTAAGEAYSVAESPLLAWLMRMRFRADVEFTDVTDEFVVLSGQREALQSVHNAINADAPALIWEDPWPLVAPGGATYSNCENHPAAMRLWGTLLLPAAATITLPEGMTWAGTWANEALRLEAWRPRFAAETDARSLPHELDWLRTAVHLNKGCYRGQETIAKVFNLGQPPRRLTMLHLDGSGHTLPLAGADVYLPHPDDAHQAGKTVGRVTSVALHHELGPIALAVLKRSTPLDAPLLVTSPDLESNPAALPVAAAQEPIVRERDHGGRAPVSRLPRA